MGTLTIPLNSDLYAVIEKTYSFRNRTVPQVVKENKVINKIEEYAIEKHYFNSIQTSSGKLLAHEDLIHEFIELLLSFVGAHLNSNETYVFTGKQGSGFKAAVTTKNKNVFLNIMVADENYYFDKYQCRVISSKLSKIYSKCEFNFYQ